MNIYDIYPGRFTGGILFGAGLTSLYQDYLGQARYLEAVQNNWAPASATVPIALILIAVSLGTFIADPVSKKKP